MKMVQKIPVKVIVADPSTANRLTIFGLWTVSLHMANNHRPFIPVFPLI
ncbi:unnamed protein product [Medioppia subpectinata]|uniref:Uncharacterized protein n=1 Tax=Medioppia subpectinata TaxID=1979941 RepID=A0A7R9LEN6_9ACAR|nr:unnamed protein product [Medioppia subpectinata]CAG2118073.1 unnamed protein product [Medioppia subpectinata]